MSKKSTIYDLADLSASSAATVSAVLNGTWQKRRISANTAGRILQVAKDAKYSVNRQASGLRKSRSGLIGMIIPMHDNRYFSSMSQTFEQLARARHLVPIVVSTLRDPKLEVETVRTLISYQIEYLVITGATDPDAVSRLCRHHNISHVNVDLPGAKAPSVITDNFWGAHELTCKIVEKSKVHVQKSKNCLYFIGGVATDHATNRRINGFTEAVGATMGVFRKSQINTCGYEADSAETAARQLYQKLGGLPRGLFINSTIALEGVVRFLNTLPKSELQGCVVGSYDWDPFAAHLSFPVMMVRQDVVGLLAEAFKMIDSGVFTEGKVVEIRPQLVMSH